MSPIQLQYSACVCILIIVRCDCKTCNMHKQQCILGLARTRKYNALLKLIYIVFVSPHECRL